MSSKNINRDLKIAEAIRSVCVEQARKGFKNASMSGLCAEGAMEAAVSAIQMVNIQKFIEDFDNSE